ncbi:hypothetical protein V7195_16175 [Priestia megaterium]|uniref:hypothetical protein n=1 Tax=Priestia megaterium TaxID=1404 RepID=UPI000BF4F896|nr:hypothetical protein [Priestia megaterium]PFK02137.1 hypothetical protein COI96_07030 [Priestia megaterium]PMD07996.1 hypothetical protein CJ194_18505 [Priestia megaterium]TJZ40348.1 hypothetical protein FA002_01905 [Priestia megaterium]
MKYAEIVTESRITNTTLALLFIFMGTIPWILNVIAVIIVLPLYVLVARFIFKKVTKGQKGTKEKIIG